MESNEEIRDLFRRYAADVGRHLGAKGRQDIEREIETTLADRLDDRAAAAGRPAAMEDALALLKESGHPRKAAAAYLAHAHLVGPELYPLFLLVCRVALPVLAAVMIGVLTLAAALDATQTASIAEHVARIIGSAAGAVLQAFGVIVLVFVGLERIEPARRAKADLDPWGNWDPRELPRASRADDIKPSEQIAAMVFGTAFLVILAFLPRLPGIWLSPERTVVVARFSDGLRGLVPFLIVSTAADILAAVFLLARRTRTAATVAVRSAAKALGIVAAGLLLAAWPLVVVDPSAPVGAAVGLRVLNQVLRGGCIIGIVAGAFDFGRELLRFERSRRSAA